MLVSLIPALVFGVAGSLAMLNDFLPTLPIMVCLFTLLGWIGVLLGCILNSLLFLAANFYLRRVVKRRGPNPTNWIWIPSLAALCLFLGLSALFYIEGVRYGIEYEGIGFYKTYALAALWTFGIAILWLRRIIKSSAGQPLAETGRSVLWFNAYLHVVFLTTMFPYFGELP
jgi:hypothetical protein